MKREAAALGALILLYALCAWNTAYIHNTTDSLYSHIEASREHFSSGEWEQARQELYTALEAWEKPGSYTHVALRHSEIDSITDDFYDLLSHLYDQSPESEGGY